MGQEKCRCCVDFSDACYGYRTSLDIYPAERERGEKPQSGSSAGSHSLTDKRDHVKSGTLTEAPFPLIHVPVACGVVYVCVVYSVMCQ